MVLLVENHSRKFVQVHDIQNNEKKLIAAIDSNVKVYKVLDLIQEKKLFFVYAVRED